MFSCVTTMRSVEYPNSDLVKSSGSSTSARSSLSVLVFILALLLLSLSCSSLYLATPSSSMISASASPSSPRPPAAGGSPSGAIYPPSSPSTLGSTACNAGRRSSSASSTRTSPPPSLSLALFCSSWSDRRFDANWCARPRAHRQTTANQTRTRCLARFILS